MNYNYKHDLSIRGLKMIDIGYLFAGSSIVGYAFARLLSKYFKFDKNQYEKNLKGKIQLGTEIVLEMCLIGIVIYIARNLVQAMPFPLDGWMGLNPPSTFKGYNHKSLKEYANPYPVAFFVILFQDSLRAKINYFTEICKF